MARLQLAWCVLASLLCIAAPASAFTEQRTVQRKSAKKPPAAQEAPPARPTPPPTLQQQPAVPPQVTLNQGQMTIVAQNSTLGDILRAVRAQTGAAMDIPPSATERVVVTLGPGTPSDVLASLLKGSHFNYVILSSPTEANKLQRVVLTSKSGGADAGPANQQSPEPANAATPQPQPMNQGQPDENPQPDDAQSNDDENAAPDANQNPDQPAPAPIKSPEQLLQELQRQQQMPQGPPGQQEQPPTTPPQQ